MVGEWTGYHGGARAWGGEGDAGDGMGTDGIGDGGVYVSDDIGSI